MPDQTRIVAPGKQPRSVRTADGKILAVPPDWDLLPPGDAGLTRRVKAAGPTWTVQEKHGRRLFSRGVWAPRSRIAKLQAALEAERLTETYAKRLAAGTARRERLQTEYVAEFQESVAAFLAFAPRYAELGRRLATAIAAHATPVGSGTVARTQRIPIERRAEAAVIAWLRHQTTAYDRLKIPRVKGNRREVRRMLAEESRRLLENYRSGKPIDPRECSLEAALAKKKAGAAPA